MVWLWRARYQALERTSLMSCSLLSSIVSIADGAIDTPVYLAINWELLVHLPTEKSWDIYETSTSNFSNLSRHHSLVSSDQTTHTTVNQACNKQDYHLQSYLLNIQSHIMHRNTRNAYLALSIGTRRPQKTTLSTSIFSSSNLISSDMCTVYKMSPLLALATILSFSGILGWSLWVAPW